MKIAVIAFSVCGAALADRILKLSDQGHDLSGYIAKRHSEGVAFEPFDSVYDLTEQLFSTVDAIVFVGACGIAVRAVAPHIESKMKDPAVIVCDETGRFAISLLSGHVGGANTLAQQIADLIGAAAVITTASDSHAAIEGTGQPRNLVLGIGCRRGLSAETIERTVTILLWNQRIPLNRICELATIDVKQDEEGLLLFAQAHSFPLNFYSAKELAKVQGEFSSSVRVYQAVGVDNVCERAAALCGGSGGFILKKTARDGVTVAVFERK